jgi:hypothetical protein
MIVMTFAHSQRIAAVVCGGIVLTWLSLILSYRANPDFVMDLAFNFNPQVPASVYGTGGFPFKVYDYPMPPLGPGPYQSVLPLVGNFLVWTLGCAVLAWALRTRGLPAPFVVRMYGAAIVTTVIGLVYLGLKFD